MNTYLNIDTSGTLISKIITSHIVKFNSQIPNTDFKDLLLELDRIHHGGLCESDEDMICDLYDNLNKVCPNQISHFMGDVTPMLRGETFGQFMRLLQTIGW